MRLPDVSVSIFLVFVMKLVQELDHYHTTDRGCTVATNNQHVALLNPPSAPENHLRVAMTP